MGTVDTEIQGNSKKFFVMSRDILTMSCGVFSYGRGDKCLNSDVL